VIGAAISGGWAVAKFRAERQDRQAERRDQKELTEAREERDRDRKVAEQRHLEIQLRESQKPFLEQQLKLYMEITKIVAQLAGMDDLKAHPEIGQRFWELYWGELSIVETPEIEFRMTEIEDVIKFLYGHDFFFNDDKHIAKEIDPLRYKWLKEYMARIKIPVIPENQSESDHINKNFVEYQVRRRIEKLAYYLAHHVRRSIETGWAVKLKDGKIKDKEDDENMKDGLAEDQEAMKAGELKVNEELDRIIQAIDRRDFASIA